MNEHEYPPAHPISCYRRHKREAHLAADLFRDLCGGPMPRVPGIDTAIRMAVRIDCGRTIEQAAVREYVYRWSLALIPSPQNAGIFGVPHAIGL